MSYLIFYHVSLTLFAWPAGVGGKGNAGVAGVIRNTPGAIGYVNQSYIRGEIKAAALQNLSGEFLQPTTEAGAIALNGIQLDKNLAGKNPNPKAKGAYPIATLTWILAYETGNGRNTKAVQESLNYLLSDKAQDKAPSLGFIPLKGDILSLSPSLLSPLPPLSPLSPLSPRSPRSPLAPLSPP